jgi:hypothetical protein
MKSCFGIFRKICLFDNKYLDIYMNFFTFFFVQHVV